MGRRAELRGEELDERNERGRQGPWNAIQSSLPCYLRVFGWLGALLSFELQNTG